MIAIVDYGVGNLFSLQSSFKAVGAQIEVTGDAERIKKAEKIVLPGVGAFADAAAKLRQSGLDTLLKEEAASGKPLLGVCLGMQLLCTLSYEYGEHRGLDLIPGFVRPIAPMLPKGLKVPHIGWNALSFTQNKHPLFANVNEGECVYFVHSYAAADCGEALIASAEYGVPLTAAIAKDKVMGTQFHPEKSGNTGLNILRAFCAM